MFSLQQALEHEYTYILPASVVLLDLKVASDPVDRQILRHCLSLKDVPKSYINIAQALYSEATGVKAYTELPRTLIIQNVHQECST